ncbi:hypothetical protein [Clostridium sp. Marseille-P2415]|nr:hypothetical protein [Clostridium sp. Marseille-P2415]
MNEEADGILLDHLLLPILQESSPNKSVSFLLVHCCLSVQWNIGCRLRE